MAWSQTDLDDLDRVIASGVRDMRYTDGSGVTYRGQAELIQLRDRMAASLANAGRPAVKAIYFS